MNKIDPLSRVLSAYSATEALNANSDKIEAAIDKTLSRDGSGPNQMLTDIDLNGYRVRNAGAPQTAQDLVRFKDVVDFEAVGENLLFLQKQEFIATENQTVFTLNSAVLPTYVSVYVAGAKLPSTAYSVSSNVVTLNSGVSENAVVAIEAFVASLLQDAATTSYNDTTVQDKLDGWVSVADFMPPSIWRSIKAGGTVNVTPYVQAAVNAAGDVRGNVWFPDANYTFGGSVGLPSFVNLVGESREGTRFNNQNVVLNAPFFINRDNGLIYVTIRNMTFLGGTHILKHSGGEQAGCTFENIAAALQTVAQFESDIWQTSCWRNCELNNGFSGIIGSGTVNNACVVHHVRFGSHTRPSIQLGGCNGFVIEGQSSFEGGGNATYPTIDLTGAAAFSLRDSYFESTRRVVLKSRSAFGAISIDGCTFMGTGAGVPDAPLTAFTFDTSTDLISLGTNFWYNETVSPQNVLIYGDNAQLNTTYANKWLQRTTDSGQVTQTKNGFVGTFDVLKFERNAAGSGDATEIEGIKGRISVDIIAFNSNGLPRGYASDFNFVCWGFGTDPMTTSAVRNTSTTIETIPGDITATFQIKPGATATSATLQLTIFGHNATLPRNCKLAVSWDGHSASVNNRIKVTPQ